MRTTAMIVAIGLSVGARADEAEDARKLRAVQEAVEHAKSTTANSAKTMGVKAKNDGCDGDRVMIKGLRDEMRKMNVDLSSCKALAGPERKDCEQPLREAFKKDMDERKQMIAESTAHIACCEHPKKKGCEDFTPLPKGM